MTTTERERAARETAHELLKTVCMDVDGRRIFAHANPCNAVTAHLLSVDDAHAAEVEGLRHRLMQAWERSRWWKYVANRFRRRAFNHRFNYREAVNELGRLRADLARVTAERDALDMNVSQAVNHWNEERGRLIGERDRLRGAIAAFEAERDRLLVVERERDDVRYRLQTVVDERFGTEPLLSCDKLIDIIEAGITKELIAEAALSQREWVLREALERFQCLWGIYRDTAGRSDDEERRALAALDDFDQTLRKKALATPTDPTTNETGGTTLQVLREALERFASEGCHGGFVGNTNCDVEMARPGSRLDRACYSCRARAALATPTDPTTNETGGTTT